MAKALSDRQRRQALEIAEMWDQLALDRERANPEEQGGEEARVT